MTEFSIVLLHAFPHSSKMWEPNFISLSRKYRVTALDLAGFGKSKAVPWTMPDAAEMIAQALDEKEIKDPVFLAGVSMGGYMELEFLKKYPERICGMGLFATKATADSAAALEKRKQSIEAVEKFGVEPFARKAVKSQLGKTTQETNPDLVEKVLGFMKEAGQEATLNAIKAIAGRRDNSGLLHKINFPVLVIAGEEDELCPPAEMKEMAALIPGAEFHVISKSGHLVNLEKQEVFQSIFEQFLEKKL